MFHQQSSRGVRERKRGIDNERTCYKRSKLLMHTKMEKRRWREKFKTKYFCCRNIGTKREGEMKSSFMNPKIVSFRFFFPSLFHIKKFRHYLLGSSKRNGCVSKQLSNHIPNNEWPLGRVILCSFQRLTTNSLNS